jgi:uncharacterized protein YqgC (DUF456 family)
MESLLTAAGEVGVWAGTIAWAGLLAGACGAVLLSLPGGWIALALAIAYDALWGFGAIGWPRLAVFAALNAVGEVVEAVLGSVYVAKRGATRWGVAGAFVGGIAGAVAGSAVAPILGTLAGGFLGAFAGAVAAEWWRDRRLEASLRVGFHATVGKLLAALAKAALAGIGATVAAVAAFRHLAG